jgi:NhaP-type Na+/H+ or K+/H+ antiporter
MLALVVILLLLLGWALIAGRLARYSVTAPLALLVAGVALTAGQDPVFVFDIEFEAAERIVEVIVAILLFTDATEVPGGVLGREPRLTLRLLLIALPLSLVAGWLVGVVLFPGLSPWLVAVLATIVMSVDLTPAVSFVRDHRIPERLRQVLNAESGLNDGIVAPTFLFCLAAATAAGSEAQADAAVDAVPALGVAFLVGAFVGAVAARVLNRALRAGWTQASALRLGVLTLPLLAYAGAVVLGGNGFIAAFVAGVFFEPEARRLPADALHLVEDVGALLSLALWFLFGAVLNDVVERGSITWQIVLYAVLALTVARMLPVAAALTGTDLVGRDRLFLGWARPRGIGSVVFGLLAYIELTGPDAEVVLAVMVVTVAASIVVHGLSTGLVTRRYGRPARRASPGSGPGHSEATRG